MHELHQPDPNKRLQFCNWVLEKVNWRTRCKRNYFLVTRRGFIYMDKNVHKITRAGICEQRQYVAPIGGRSASQGREWQPSEVARSIWMTQYKNTGHFNSYSIKLLSHHTHFLTFNFICPNLRESYFYRLNSGFQITNNSTFLVVYMLIY